MKNPCLFPSFFRILQELQNISANSKHMLLFLRKLIRIPLRKKINGKHRKKSIYTSRTTSFK